MAEYITVAGANDISSGQSKVFEVKGNQVAVCNINGNYYAFANICPHRGGPVGEGEIEGTVITCPWHGWAFDITTCVNTMNPLAKLTKYDIKIDNNELKINA